jgi:exopolysaccharide biosynthesis predicted pyruvyltransferase EpsI/glycosyltransferase involved in cell wall biosynthesis
MMCSNNTKSLISIIVPVFNVEKYLHRSLTSILSQSYERIEVLLVDDGSTDNSGAICDAFSTNDDRISVFHKQNSGLSSARNTGIENAHGDFLLFVDSDDWIKQDMVEKLLLSMQENKADIAMCGFIITDGINFRESKWFNRETVLDGKEAFRMLLEDDYVTSHAWNKLFRTPLFNGIRFPEGKFYEDIYMMHKIFLRVNEVVMIDSHEYYYFVRSDSITANISFQKRIDYVKSYASRYNDVSQIYPEYKAILLKSVTVSTLISLGKYYTSRKDRDEFAVEIGKLMKFLRARDNIKLVFQLLSSDQKLLYFTVSVLGLASYKIYSLFTLLKNVYRIRLHTIFKIEAKYKKLVRIVSSVNALCKVKLDCTARNIIFIGIPEYNNLGDHAIAYATQRFVEENLPQYRLLQITEDQIRSRRGLAWLRRNACGNSILLLQGGGNMGNFYPDQEYIRRKIIRNFTKNRIVVFPQTVSFTPDKKGRSELLKTQTVYCKHPHLLLVARERESYHIMKEIFPKIDVLLTPDIVMSLQMRGTECQRSGILVCLRNDSESKLTESEKTEIYNICRNSFYEIRQTDTCVHEPVSLAERNSYLEKKWEEFRKAEIVITDRLHGVIFAAISSTPCICFENGNHKIRGICEWFESSNCIRICTDLTELPQMIRELPQLRKGNFNAQVYQPYFSRIAERITM